MIIFCYLITKKNIQSQPSKKKELYLKYYQLNLKKIIYIYIYNNNKYILTGREIN